MQEVRRKQTASSIIHKKIAVVSWT